MVCTWHGTCTLRHSRRNRQSHAHTSFRESWTKNTGAKLLLYMTATGCTSRKLVNSLSCGTWCETGYIFGYSTAWHAEIIDCHRLKSSTRKPRPAGDCTVKALSTSNGECFSGTVRLSDMLFLPHAITLASWHWWSLPRASCLTCLLGVPKWMAVFRHYHLLCSLIGELRCTAIGTMATWLTNGSLRDVLFLTERPVGSPLEPLPRG